MFWNAPIPAWAVLLMVMVLALLVLYFALLEINRQHTTESRIERKQRTIDALVTERDEERAQRILAQDQRTKLNRENEALQAEVERLKKPDLTTLPLQEAVPPKRPPRSGPKKGAP